MSFSNELNVQNEQQKNGPNDHLARRYSRGRWINNKMLQELAIRKYEKNGMGITFIDVSQTFGCSKKKAQRKLKNVCVEKLDKNGKKYTTLFTLYRKKPQQYYPSCMRGKVVEGIRKKQNRQIDTTGGTSNNKTLSSKYPLDNALEYQTVSSFLFQLSLLPFQPLEMHNIHLWSQFDRSDYDELPQKPSFNQTKIEIERIGLREVVYRFHKRGSIQIDISCSRYPFKIETDNDVYSFFVFLGRVQERMANILSDFRDRIVPPVDMWILKSCDFNKDVEIKEFENLGQLMALNIQIKHVGKAFRLYVKNMEKNFVLRGENTGKINQPITTFLNDSIQTPFHFIDTKFNEISSIIEKRLEEISNRIEKLENKCFDP